jgi:2-dehydropantoate 2-reductase
MARVAVVGVGAIGGALVAQLDATGRHEITMCTRRPLHELIVKTPEGTVSVKTRNLTDPTEAEAVDWVVVATKTYNTEGTAQWLRKLAPEGVPVAVAQNGVEHKERFAPLVQQDLLVPVVVQIAVERQADGTMWQRGGVRLIVDDQLRGREFADLFRGSKSEVALTRDFKTEMWRKLCVNSTGTLSVLARKPFAVYRTEAMARVALEMARECVSVGRAEGAQLDDDVAQSVVEGFQKGQEDRVNSMLADCLAGRLMEIDARNGVIVRLGERHGIPTPLNRMAVAVLESIDRIGPRASVAATPSEVVVEGESHCGNRY